jgi:hypothetical protein
MPGLHEHFLDFEILETGNSKTLVFVDSSDYMENPESPLLEVIMPGYTKYLLTNVDARVVNTFNSSTLGFNQVLNQHCLVDLPDGVWQFKYKICPYKYVYKAKKHLRITLLLKKLQELYNKVDISECAGKEDKDLQSSLVQIHILIEGAKAAVETDSKKAHKYYQLADKLVQRLLDKFCKNCK